MTDVHLINHTHWDREWFLTEEYTTAWIPDVIDSLERLVAQNPNYDYLFDGQTLVIEDLLRTRPDYEDRVRRLVEGGQLEIGPCYSQPDWRMTSGELHVRNLTYGMSDAERLGGSPTSAWLVDTFGHISQAPQLLSQAGLTSAFVWRGVPKMVPLFRWTGPDGTELAAIDLFGGYRNLYGISRTPDIALERLVAETDKLAPSYGDMPVPLFDGYDLDVAPEDPFRVYEQLAVPERIQLHESSPGVYAAAVMSRIPDAPAISGELISGKYGSTFPGSLSARTYLKVAHHDAERAIHRRLEPISAFAQAAGIDIDLDRLERASRVLLQNAVHDCLCGVSIDQVHERMERSYRETLEWADQEQTSLLRQLMPRFGDGLHAISTTAMDTDVTVRAGDRTLQVERRGIGVTPVTNVHPVRVIDAPVDVFEWKNSHFDAAVTSDGITVGSGGRLARLVVREDRGDTYSSEPGQVLGELHMTSSPIQLDETDVDATIRTQWELATGSTRITAEIDVRFDQSAVIDLVVRLDSIGVGYRVDALFETGVTAETVHASMPFDIVERPHDDHDLFDTNVDAELSAILMGQRETGHVTEFPFHDFVALTDGTETRAVLAEGLRSYRSTSDGVISVALRRSVEWLALTGLQLRSGDAGPAMYVPGARCERMVEHRIGFAVTNGGIDGLIATNEGFHHPPIIAEVSGTGVEAIGWQVTRVPLPTTAIVPGTDSPTVRLVNTTTQPVELADGMQPRTIRNAPLESGSVVQPHVIVSTPIELPALPPMPAKPGSVTVLTPITHRVGPAAPKPDPKELDQLAERIANLEVEVAENRVARSNANGGSDGRRLEHREYVLDRERLELALSLELNRRRAESTDEVSIPDEADPVISAIGAELNELRIKRRIWDYVVQALG